MRAERGKGRQMLRNPVRRSALFELETHYVVNRHWATSARLKSQVFALQE
jgi:hypothetical protein